MKKTELKKSIPKVTAGQKCYVIMHSQGKHMDKEVKFIGIFSSKKTSVATVKLLKQQPGFKDVGRFSIDIYTTDRVQWSEGFVSE